MDFYTPPIDYAGMQPQHDLAKTFGSGFAIGDAIQNSIFARKKEEAALERQKTMQERTHAVFTNPNATAKDIGGLALEFPEIAEHVGQAWKMMDEGKKEEHLKTYVPAYAAILNGKNDIAIKLMRDKAAAHRNSGDEEGAASDEDFADMIEQNPEQARNMGGMYLAAGLGADKFIDKFTGLNSEDRAQAQEGRNQAEEQRKAESAPVELETKIADMTAKQAVADNAGVVEAAKAYQEQSKATKDAVEAAHAEEKTQADINKTDADTVKAKAEAKKASEEDAVSDLTPDAMNEAAERYRVDGTMPSLGQGKVATKTRHDILNRASFLNMMDKVTANEARQLQISGKNTSTALAQLGKQKAMIGAYEKNASLGGKLAAEMSEKVDRTGSPIVNKWIQAGKKSVTGDADISAFNAANETFVNEYAKIMSGSMGNTPVSDSARQHAHDMLNTVQSKEQYKAVMNVLNKDMGYRMDGINAQEQELKDALKRGGKDLPDEKPTTTPDKPPPAKSTAATTPKLESASRTPSMKAMAEKMGLTDAQLDAFLKKNGH